MPRKLGADNLGQEGPSAVLVEEDEVAGGHWDSPGAGGCLAAGAWGRDEDGLPWPEPGFWPLLWLCASRVMI